MNRINSTQISYQGLVDIKYLHNGQELVYHGHNEGLNAMFKYICKILTGDISTAVNESPTFLDARCEYYSGEEVKRTSVLYSKLSISNPEYFFDTELTQWVTRFSIVISYNMIDSEKLKSIPEDAATYLYLVSNNGVDFARLRLPDDGIKLSDIIPGTQALVQWTMLFENKVID